MDTGCRPTTLVVEHDAEVRDLLAYTLAHLGHAVLTASDSGQALEHWRIHSPDLVLLEPVLLAGDGLALCRHFRCTAATPVILITARGGADDMREGLAAGASDYVTKPFSPRQLLSRIQDVLQRPAG